ncbi:MAG: hypothetical protein U0103_20980 [Candidatus Obscuribacterales bacterium]|jgi:hypothetical protein|nr:hypothetical protein [Cyanobacteria bacterium SZAS LIN-5]
MGKNNPVENTDAQKSMSLEPTTTYGAMWREVGSILSGNIKDIAAEKFQLFSRAEANATIGQYAMSKGWNPEDDVYDFA